MPQGEHGERPPKHYRGGQNLPKRQFRLETRVEGRARILTGITFDSGPASLQERYYPEPIEFSTKNDVRRSKREDRDVRWVVGP
jgi:hypothetical protein